MACALDAIFILFVLMWEKHSQAERIKRSLFNLERDIERRPSDRRIIHSK
jgi:hypothetical protein